MSSSYLWVRIFVIAASAAAWSRVATAEDLLGWQNTRWGMSEAEVTTETDGKAEPSEGRHRLCFGSPSSFELLRMLDVSIENMADFVAVFCFSPSNRLSRVSLLRYNFNHDTPQEAIRGFTAVEEALTRKYGPPTQKRGSIPSSILEIWNTRDIWVMPTTTIVLSIEPGIVPATQLSISYSPTQQDNPL